MAVNASNIKLEPMEFYFGARNRDSVTASGVVDGKYFDFEVVTDLAGTKALYRAWYDLDNLSTPPAAGGRTLVEIDIATGDTASVVASKSATALNAVAKVASKSTGAVFYIQGHIQGAVVAAVDGDTGFTFANSVAGSSHNLGATSGPTEIDFGGGTETVDVTANQTGGILLAKLVTSVGASVSATILELTATNYKKMVGDVIGDALTPAGGTELVGMGENAVGKNLLTVGKELLLKPVNSLDDSRNITFFKAAPTLQSGSFSGVDPSSLEVEFSVFLDNSVDKKINLWAFGDSHQDIWV